MSRRCFGLHYPLSLSLSASVCALGLTLLTGCGSGTTTDADAGTGSTGSLPGGGGGPGSPSGSGGEFVGVGASGPVETEPECTGARCTPAASCQTSVAGSPVLRRLAARELKATLEAAFEPARGKWTFSLSADPVSHLGFDNEASRLLVTNQTAREIDSTAESLGQAIAGDALSSLLPCSTGQADRACAGEFVSKYGKRLFRRPLTPVESDSYLSFFDEALESTDFPTAISWVTRALVSATPTLYRKEIGVAEAEARRLSQYEVASELAFTYTGQGPDDALLARADAGELSSPEVLIQTARDLLETEAGQAQVQRFFEASLEYGRVTSLTKNNVQNFNDLRSAMLEETRRLVDAVVIKGGGGLRELLTTKTTYPSRALASHYGMPAPSEDHAPVERTSGIGILAQGSFLSTEASARNSSPTQRGLLILEKLLCETPPTVPPDVPDLPEPTDQQTTTRQRYEELHFKPDTACANCHSIFDPIGFGFENYDETGRFREDEHGISIDASGSIPVSTPIETFESQEELATALAEMPAVHSCVSGNMKTFVYGVEDACLGESKREALINGEVGLLDYLASLAGEPHFIARRLQ